MVFCGSAAGHLAVAAGQLLLEGFLIGVGVVIEAVWVNLGSYILTDV